jgi:hypothetical protein
VTPKLNHEEDMSFGVPDGVIECDRGLRRVKFGERVCYVIFNDSLNGFYFIRRNVCKFASQLMTAKHKIL